MANTFCTGLTVNTKFFTVGFTCSINKKRNKNHTIMTKVVNIFAKSNKGNEKSLNSNRENF